MRLSHLQTSVEEILCFIIMYQIFHFIIIFNKFIDINVTTHCFIIMLFQISNYIIIFNKFIGINVMTQ